MALQYAHGAVQWLSADAATVEYAVTGLGFVPKAMRFTCVGIASDTDAASQTTHWRASIGFAISPTWRTCQASQSQDNAGTQVCSNAYRNDAVVATCTSTPAVDGLLDLKTIDVDGFTLIVDDAAPVDVTVFWEAWGGSDILDYYLGEIAEPAATGLQTYVTGFAPDVVMFGNAYHGTGAANTVERNDAQFMLGATTGPASAENIVAVANDDDASTTSDTDRYALSGECLAAMVIGGGNPSARATLSSWTEGGFILNWLARATTNRRYIFLAIRGGIWRAGSTTIAGNSASATATVTTERRGLEFQPSGLSFMGVSLAASSAGTSSTEGKIGFGCGSSTSSRRAMGVWSENGNATASEIDVSVEYDSCFAMPGATGAIAETLDIDAVLSNGFRLIVDTAGGVASEWVGFLACGSYRNDVSPPNYKTPIGSSSVDRIY